MDQSQYNFKEIFNKHGNKIAGIIESRSNNLVD